MYEIRNASDFSGQSFGYHISDIISDVRRALRICYDALPYLIASESPTSYKSITGKWLQAIKWWVKTRNNKRQLSLQQQIMCFF